MTLGKSATGSHGENLLAFQALYSAIWQVIEHPLMLITAAGRNSCGLWSDFILLHIPNKLYVSAHDFCEVSIRYLAHYYWPQSAVCLPHMIEHNSDGRAEQTRGGAYR